MASSSEEGRPPEETPSEGSGSGETDAGNVARPGDPINFEAIPKELRDQSIWCAWKPIPPKEGSEKPRKLPINPATGEAAKCNDPTTWGTFDQAWARMRNDRLAGISFALAADGPYTGIDLDSCRDPKTGELDPRAREIINSISTYTEASPSGTGVHLIVRGKLPPGGRKKGHIEMYDCGRFLTVTGWRIGGTPTGIEERADEVALLHAEVFGLQVDENNSTKKGKPLSDEELLAKAGKAKNHRKFQALWEGDTRGYASHSEADLALCSLLNFWARGDRAQVDRLFRRSGLMRPKWDEKHGERTYGESTIATALEMQSNSGGSGSEEADKSSAASRLVELALGEKIELFHDRDNVAYARVPVDTHHETWRLSDRNLELWLRRLFYAVEKSAPSSNCLTDARGQLDAKAIFDGEEREVFVRIAGNEGTTYLDLGRKDWAVVEIGIGGWRVVSECPVRFRRPRGLAELPMPTHGGSVDDLREFVNCENRDWPLILAWLVACFLPKGPFVLLELLGEQGSAKSTTARVLRRLADPSTAELRGEPREVRDLIISAANSWLAAYDNLSSLPLWLSDALCRLATGGGLSTRMLYTDDEEKLFDFQRPVEITGIEDVIVKPDLLDRAIVAYLPPLSDTDRRTEREFWERFDAAQPRILGALLTAVAAGLRRRPEVKLERPPRMADFATWAVACEPALGFQPGTFLAAYMGNRAAAVELSLEASVVAQAVIGYMDTFPQGTEGTATEILKDLEARFPDEKRPHGWPKGAQPFAGKLRGVAPNLRAIGINVLFSRDGKRRYIVIRWAPGRGPEFDPGPRGDASDGTGPGVTRPESRPSQAQVFVDTELAKGCDADDANDAVSRTPTSWSEGGDQRPLHGCSGCGGTRYVRLTGEATWSCLGCSAAIDHESIEAEWTAPLPANRSAVVEEVGPGAGKPHQPAPDPADSGQGVRVGESASFASFASRPALAASPDGVVCDATGAGAASPEVGVASPGRIEADLDAVLTEPEPVLRRLGPDLFEASDGRQIRFSRLTLLGNGRWITPAGQRIKVVERWEEVAGG